jgi:hypothetical protein
MSTTTPPRNGQVPTASGPPVIQQPLKHGQGPPGVPPPVGRGHWYRRGWVIALGALLVGLGIGVAAGSTKTAPRAATVTLPAQTVVQKVPAGPTKTVVHVRTVPGPTKTVAGPTTTVTQTVSASTPAPAASTPSSGSGAQSSSGKLTTSQQNAVAAAQQYLATSAFSMQGLIDQLDSSAGSGFSVNDATVAVDSLNVNWDSEAVQAAKQYLQTSPFSCQGMVQQLSSSAGSQFTQAQAQYGATKVGLC